MSAVEQDVLVEPDDGSLGPLLRIADDRLAPGESYGAHDHRAVDVVAVVLTGSLTHAWDEGTTLTAGDVGVLRAGAGIRHDERAGPGGARVLQCYLRAADPAEPASHEVVRAAAGWIDLRRSDARLWVGRHGDSAPEGLAVVPEGTATVVVWQLDAARPSWAG
jgi:redox-sensitive bicupin YhaK (pirin superfamily)